MMNLDTALYILFSIFTNTIATTSTNLPPVMNSYDCSLPSVTKSYPILDSETCEDLKQRSNKNRKPLSAHRNGVVYMLVLQKKQFIQIKKKTCSISSKASLDYCGISAIHHLIDEVSWNSRLVNARECRILWEGGSIIIDGNHIKGLPYKEHTVIHTVGAGHVQDDNCG